MKDTLKSFLLFTFGVLLFSYFCGFAVVRAEILTVNLEAPQYHLDTTINGHHVIEMDDFGNLLRPGKPELPARVFMIALPPGAEVTSVDIRPTGLVEEYENIKIAPAPPALPNSEDSEMVTNCLANWRENYNKTYSSDEPYPQAGGEYLGTGGLRKYTFARVAFYPFTYNPVSEKLTYNSSLEVSINYNQGNITEKMLSDTKADRQASKLFVNYADAESWYRPQAVRTSTEDTYNYIIITNTTLSPAIEPLVSWKGSLGFSLGGATTGNIESQYTGVDLAEKIRNFLIDKYIDWGIEYVLLVGDIDVIPMRQCFPDASNHNPNSGYCPPTDYYYADLTGNWDSDGDGYFGEAGSDAVDYTPEVLVGRIPYSDFTTVNAICEKLVAFESDTSSWKNNALLLGAISNFRREDYNDDWDETDGASLMEYMITDMLTGWNYTTMYETEGIDASSYDCDISLNNTNVVSEWSSGQYGVVNWWAHGGSSAAYRKYWSWDDGDMIPETSSPDEIDMPVFLYGSDAASLDDDHSSIIFSCACNNAYAETESLAKRLLKNGSAGIVGSTRLSWYSVGWSHKNAGGNASIDYYFFDYLLNDDETVGQALFDSKLYYLNNFFWWDWESPQNMYDFCLYGDPAMVLEGAVIPGCCVGVRGNADSDTGESLNISDITYLVAYCFGGGPAPGCIEEGNVSGDEQETINISDITYLVGYCFGGGPLPPDCPQ